MVLLSLKLMSGWDLFMRVCHVCHGLDHRPHHHALLCAPLPLHPIQVGPGPESSHGPGGRPDLHLAFRKPDANWGSSAQAQVFVNALRGVQVSNGIYLDLYRIFV